jgi:hypothetical protein
MEENEIGGICRAHGGVEKCVKIIFGKTKVMGFLRRHEDKLNGPYRNSFRVRRLIRLGQGKCRWRALVNTKVNLRVS